MENPIKMDDLGGKPTIFGSIQMVKLVVLGFWWFGDSILRVPPSNNPFHKGIAGIQTTNPNHYLRRDFPKSSVLLEDAFPASIFI